MSNAIYVKFTDVEGESTDAGHEGWCKIEGFSHHLSNTVDRSGLSGTGGLASGISEHGDLTFTKVLDKASLELMQRCCSGQHFPSVELEVMVSMQGDAGAPKHKLLNIILQGAIISDISYSDSSGNPGRPTENISVAYTKIEWIYEPYKDGAAGGAIPKYWDLLANQGG